MHSHMRLACLLGICLSMSACAPLLTAFGTNATLVQTVSVVERVKLGGDGVSLAASQKTITDHAISYAVGKDCKMFNILAKKSVCSDTPIVAIKASPNADTPTQISALDATIKTAADGEMQAEHDTTAAGMLTADAGLQRAADTPSQISALGSNIKQAVVREPQVNASRDVQPAAAAAPPEQPKEELATIAGTNLKRQVDPSLASAQPKDEAATVASASPAQAKDSAAAGTSPADEPRAEQPQTIAHPDARVIDVSRESGSGD